MANKSLLTTISKSLQVDQTYWSDYIQFYSFLSAVDPWLDDNDPNIPTQDQKTLKNIRKNIFVAKKIARNDICPVIQRIDWAPNIVYEYYRDDIDLSELNPNGTLVYKFYVMNKYYQVFKCLWNNNSSPSTIEPYFEPGTYGTNKIFKGSDGYKWKFMFTVDTQLRVRFMDDNWIPIIAKEKFPSSLDNNVGTGNIDVINVISGGTGYDSANIHKVIITGDGTASNGTPFTTATADVVTSGGIITDIIMTDVGKNYTYATADIQSSSGTGCIIAANTVSPIGGHGADPVGELACQHIMLTSEFNGSENGNIPTDITYYQLGIIANPTTKALYPDVAESTIYRTSLPVLVSFGSGGVFLKNDIVWQGGTANYTESINNATFVGKVLNFNTSTNILYLINIKGTPSLNKTLFSQSGTSRTLLSVDPIDFISQSGYIVYIENRSGIQRSSDGIEQFRVVLGY